MRQRIVAGNWKMHGQLQANAALLHELSQVNFMQTQLIVCPPFVYLSQVQECLAGKKIALGAQNINGNLSGAHTGEVSVLMLTEFGCEYVILGHSERRHIYGEQDAEIARKFALVKAQGLKPILCVGETQAEREAGEAVSVVKRQLSKIFELDQGVGNFNGAVIAYEPVWAIGTGLAATPDQAQKMHETIRQHLAEYDTSIAENISILYGGSVKGANATDLFAMPDIDGALVGGASLRADEFLTICQRAEEQ